MTFAKAAGVVSFVKTKYLGKVSLENSRLLF